MPSLAMTMKDLWYAMILSATLVAAILLVMGLQQILIEPIRKRRKIGRRVSEGAQEYLRRVQVLKERSEDERRLRWLKKMVGAKPLAELETHLLQADNFQDVGTFLTRVFTLILLGFLVGFLAMKSVLAGLVVGVVLGMVPFVYLEWRKKSKSTQFERQMPDAMELLARSLRAGHTLPSAVQLVGMEMADPMGTEMKIAYEEQRYGIGLPDAFLHMLERVESMDLRYFTAAVLIQQDTGGNLAELMEKIAQVIRNRLNMKAKIRSLTAMGRLSAIIMVVVPVLAFFGLLVVAPHYVEVLYKTSTGRITLVAGIGLVLVGWLLLRRLIQAIEV